MVLEDTTGRQDIVDADDKCPVEIPIFPVKEDDMIQEDADSAVSRSREVTDASKSVPDAGSDEEFIPSLVASPSASETENLKEIGKGRKTRD